MIIRKYKEKCQVEKLNIQVKWTNSLKDTNAQQTNSRKNYLNVITSIKLNLLFKNLTKKKETPVQMTSVENYIKHLMNKQYQFHTKPSRKLTQRSTSLKHKPDKAITQKAKCISIAFINILAKILNQNLAELIHQNIKMIINPKNPRLV